MNQHQAAALNALARHAANARRSARATRADADAILTALTDGNRPPHTPDAVTRTAADLTAILARVDAALETVGMLGADPDDVQAAYTGTVSYFSPVSI